MDHPLHVRIVAIGLSDDLSAALRGDADDVSLIRWEDAAPERPVPDHLGAFVADEKIGTKQIVALIDRLEKLRRWIPVALLSERSIPLARFGTRVPDLVCSSAQDLPLLRRRLFELLNARLYPNEIVEATVSSAIHQFEAAFHTPVTVEEIYLEAESAPEEINAFVAFCGPHVSGRLSVGADQATLLEIRRRTHTLTGGTPTQDAEDLAGEVANLTLGDFKRNLARFNLSFECGTPALYSGKTTVVRFPATPTRVLVKLRCGDIDGALSVATTLDSITTGEIRVTTGHDIASGDFLFL